MDGVLWILVSLAVSVQPGPQGAPKKGNSADAQLGVYETFQGCRAAIRKIFETKYNIELLQKQGVDVAPLKEVVDRQLGFQRQYVCIQNK